MLTGRAGSVNQEPMGNSTTRDRNGSVDSPSLLHQIGCSWWKKKAQAWRMSSLKFSAWTQRVNCNDDFPTFRKLKYFDIIPASNEKSIMTFPELPFILRQCCRSNCTTASFPWTGRMNPAFYWITLTAAIAVVAVKSHIMLFYKGCFKIHFQCLTFTSWPSL